jgi:putative addiction module component (TIGR02574 family)
MSTLETLQAEVEKLSPADRARLLEHLVERLEQDPDVESAWEAVAQARQEELKSGRVKPVPLDEAVARLQARFPG